MDRPHPPSKRDRPRWKTAPWVAALAVLSALLGLGCATLAKPGPADAAWAAGRWPGTTLDDLSAGRALYVQRCAGCHALYRPERYPPELWAPHIDEMAERAALKDGERGTLLRYLETMSRPKAAPPVVEPGTPGG